jgi:hypothetical protein
MKLWPRPELTPVEQAQAVLVTTQERRERIATQLTQSQAELSKIKSDAASAALREAPLEVAEISADVAQCAAAVEALEHALGAADGEVAAARQALAAAQDAEQRLESVRVIADIIQAINAAAPTISTGVADLIAALGRASPFSLDARQVLGVFEQLQSDLSVLVNTAVKALDHHAKQVGAGLGRPTLPRPQPAPTPVARSMPPDTVSLCLLYDGRWRDPASGLERHAAKGWDIGLTPDIARRVIAAGVAVPSDSAQAKILRRERASPAPNADAIDLDDPNVAPPGPPKERMINVSRAAWQLPGDAGPPSWFGKPT